MPSIRERIKEYRRVISVATKPDREEFINSVKITAFGIALIGSVGFVVYLIYTAVMKLFGG